MGVPQAAHSASISEQGFEDIYVFGDSLSDDGNVFQATGGVYPPSPPYFQGRLSNGPVWVEYLAPELGAESTNYAYGGASTGVGNAVFPTAPLPGLLSQVGLFTQANPQADPNALYTVWAGANDYLFATATDPTEPVTNISAAVSSLYDAGARNIMVFNLPDLGQLPSQNASPVISASLNAVSDAHNSGLAASLGILSQQPDINIISVDVNSLFKQAIANPAEYGFTNVTDSCLTASSVCANPNEYLFWDEFHPTTATHKLVANVALSSLKSEAVPEPSTTLGFLAFSTLGGVAVLKRSRKKLG